MKRQTKNTGKAQKQKKAAPARPRRQNREAAKPRSGRAGPAARAFQVSVDTPTRCAVDYATALHNPFMLSPNTPVCYPIKSSGPSFKFRTRVVTDFYVGTGGVGGVAFWPFRMVMKDTPVTQVNHVVAAAVCTTSTYASTDFSFANSPIKNTTDLTTSVAAGYNSPFSWADISPGNARAVRLVACGAKVRYTSRVLDTEGSIVAYRHTYPTTKLEALLDAFQDLTAMPNTSVAPVTVEKPAYTSYMPLLESDSFYIPALNFGQEENIENRLGGVVAVKGAPVGSRFEVEIVAYFEMIGRYNTLTPSHVQPQAAAEMANMAAHAPPQASAPQALAPAAIAVGQAFLQGAASEAKRQARSRFKGAALRVMQEVGKGAISAITANL